MNDIAKKAASDKFLNALEKENLSKAEAGSCLDLVAAQVSYLFNEKYWSRLGRSGWYKILKWVNSGQGLKEYSEKHGKVLPEKKHSEVANDEIEMLRKNLSNYKQIVPENININTDDLLKTDLRIPRVPKKERANLDRDETKPSLDKEPKKEESRLATLLREEKALLEEQIQNINAVLKFY